MITIKYVKDFAKWLLVEQPFSENSVKGLECFFVGSRLIIFMSKQFFQ